MVVVMTSPCVLDKVEEAGKLLKKDEIKTWFVLSIEYLQFHTPVFFLTHTVCYTYVLGRIFFNKIPSLLYDIVKIPL